MILTAIRTILIATLLFFTSQVLNGQKQNPPAKLPTLKYSKIKKAKVITEDTSFKAFICDIDSSYVYYYNAKKETKRFMKNRCTGCEQISTKEVLSLQFPKLSIWGHITNYIGILGSIGGTIAVITTSKEKDDHGLGFGKIYAVNILTTSLGINIGNTAATINRRDRRTITKEELNEHSFADSWSLIAYRSYRAFIIGQQEYCYAYHDHVKQYPNKSKVPKSFTMKDGSVHRGYIVKVANDKVYLTETIETLVDLRKTQVDTDLNFDIIDIESIKRLYPFEYQQ